MKRNIFKAATAVAGVYHIILAVIGLLFSAEMTTKASQVALGVVLKVDPQMMFVAKFAAAYMLAFGIMLLSLAYNPVQYRLLAVPAAALFAVRFLNRVFLFNAVSSTLGMSWTRNFVGSALIFLFFALIYFTRPTASEAVAN